MDCSRARTKNPTEWLELCPDYSRPLVEQLADWILTWEPDLSSSIKWNMLCFSGRKLVCGLSACQRHLGISLFRGTELPDPTSLFSPAGEGNTNIRTIRITSLAECPPTALRAMLRAAVELDADPMIPPAPKGKRKPWPVPSFFKEALAQKQNRIAAENFRRLSPSCQREYLVWLTMAKRPETRDRRLRATLASLVRNRKWQEREAR